MSDEQRPRITLDGMNEAVRELLADDMTGDGEMVTAWLLVAGTRGFDGGGVVIVQPSDEALPQWEVRGLLSTALRSVDRSEDADQREED